MSNLNTREEKLKLVFAAHPNAKEIFMASDDRAFFKRQDAEGYAQGLKDQEVKKFSRPFVEAYLKVKEAKADTGAGEGETTDSITGDGSGQSLEELTKEGDETEEKTSEGDSAPEAGTKGKSDESGDKADSDESGKAESGDDRAAVVAQYEEVIGKKPNNFMKVETMKAKIAEALAAK